MRKILKTRILCMLLSVAMVFGMMPQPVHAEEGETDSIQEAKTIAKGTIHFWDDNKGVFYKINSDGLMEVWQYMQEDEDLGCDYTLDGFHSLCAYNRALVDYKHASDASEYAYYDYADQIKNLVIGEPDDTFGSDMINYSGTWRCDGGVLNIGPYAFCDYQNLETVTWYMYSHDKDYIKREDGRRDYGYEVLICARAFARCYNLKEIYLKGTIPNNYRILEDDEMEKLAESNTFEGVTAMVYVYPESGIKPTSSMVQDYGGDLTWAYLYDKNIAKDPANHTVTAYLTFDGKLVIRGDGEMMDFSKQVDIPWFNESDLVQEIVVEDGVTGIGNWAFSACGSAKTATLADSVTKIGGRAFRSNEKLMNITLPSKLESIGDYAFYDCLSLKEIILPDSVKSIGEYAFRLCSSLQKVSLNEGLESIGASAFTNCYDLSELTIPSTVTYLGKMSLNVGGTAYIDFLCRDVTVNGAVFPQYPVGHIYATSPRDGVWTKEFKATISSNSTKVHWQLEEADGVCGDNLQWSYCNHILTITGTGAMYDYSLNNPAPWDSMKEDLYHVSLPDGLTSIGSYAFYGSELYTATLPESVTTIGSRAFSNLNGFGPLVCLGKPSNIAADAFYGEEFCVYYNSESGWNKDNMLNYGGNLDWIQAGGRCGDNLLWVYESTSEGGRVTITGSGKMYDSPNLGFCAHEVILPEGLTYIGRSAFSEFNLETITLPESLNGIGDDAFRDCTRLTAVNLPQKLEKIGNYAFAGCTSLTEFVIPESVTFLGSGVLQDCTKLKSVKLPSNMTDVPSNLFRNCAKLESVEMPSSVTLIGSYAFAGCAELKSLDIPKGVRKIQMDAFEGCTGIQTLVISEGVKDLLRRTFRNMTNLQEITLPGSLQSIGDNCFEGCTSLSRIYYGGTEEEWQDIAISGTGNNVLKASSCTIYSLGGTWNGIAWDVDLGTGTLTISGSGNMSNDTNTPWKIYTDRITGIVIEKGITGIGKNAFGDATNLEKVSLPDGLLSIGEAAFKGCSALKKINIPSTVASIGNYAFADTGLTDMTLPKQISSIGEYTFNGCSQLKAITIPKSLLNIGRYNFDSTPELKNVYYEGAYPEWQKIEIAPSNDYLTNLLQNTTGLHCDGVIHGTCGEHITWTVTERTDVNHDGTADILLLIEGTGEMSDFAGGGPWNEYYAGKIQYIYISEGITSIGNQAFQGNTIVGLALPLSLTKIGTNAFQNCTVKDASYAGSTEQYKAIQVQSGNDALKSANMVMNWTMELDSCKVTFEMNGHGAQVKIQNILVGNTITEPELPAADGYDFDGWYSDKGCTKAYDFDKPVQEDMTLYAAWSSTLTFTTQPKDYYVKTGIKAYFDAEAESGAGLAISYRWKKSTDGVSWGNSSSTGAKSEHLEVTAKKSFDGLYFRCDATDAAGKVVSSDVVILHVVEKYEVTEQPLSEHLGTLNGKAVFTTNCNDSGAKYQWQKCTSDSGKFSDCSSELAKDRIYPLSPLKASYDGWRFRCKITCDDGTVLYSNESVLHVNDDTIQPTAIKLSGNVSAKVGDTASFKATVSNSDVTYQWMKSTDGGKTWVKSTSAGATTDSLTLTAKKSFNNYLFKCVVTDATGAQVESTPVKLTVDTAAATEFTITTQPKSATVVTGTAVKFAAAATGNGLKYQWKISKDGGTSWINSGSTGATTSILSMTAKLAFNGYQFKCVVTDQSGQIAESNVVTLNVTAK